MEKKSFAFGLAGKITTAFLALIAFAFAGFIYFAVRLGSALGDLRTMMLIFAVALAIGSVAVVYLIRTFTKPVRLVSGVFHDIAEGDGDLTKRLEISANDEVGDLSRYFNSFMDRLSEIMGLIAESAFEVSSTSQELSATTEESSAISGQIAVTMQQVARGSQDQSASAGNSALAVAELASAIQTMAEGTEEQAAHVQTAADVTEQASQSLNQVLAILREVAEVTSSNVDSAAKGADSVQAVMKNTQRIGASTAEVSARVSELSELSKEIRSIVGVIADIASQTNLLALNAAIEAARAGEYGRGFAVVADEVRGLAERSSQETKTIGGLIQKIGEAINKAVASMAASASDVATGQSLARDAGAALDAIHESASVSKDMVASLITSSQSLQESSATTTLAITQIVEIAEKNASVVNEMASSSEEVKRLIDEVAATSEESAAAAEEVSASTEEMNKTTGQVSDAAQSLAAMAEKLQQIVKRFKV